MRLAAFASGLLALFLLLSVSNWVFITTQFPAGPLNVLMSDTGLLWLVKAVFWLMLASLVCAAVAVLTTWRPRLARGAFTVSAITWAPVAILYAWGMLSKLLGQGTAPAQANTLSILLNLALVIIPLLALLGARYLARRAEPMTLPT